MTDLKLVPDRTCQDLAQAHHDTPQWLQVYQRYKIIAETTSRRTDTQKKKIIQQHGLLVTRVRKLI